MKYDSMIKQITFGIRYNRNFRVTDLFGHIVDDIIADKSPLTDIFDEVSRSSSEVNLRLRNTKTLDLLNINNDDIILTLNINNDFNKRFNWLKKDVIGFYKNLFLNHEIRRFKRMGIVFQYEFENFSNIEGLLSTMTDGVVDEVNNIEINFTKKYPSSGFEMYRKDVYDYKNTIYTVKKKDNKYKSSFDFQYYFEPEIYDFRESPTDKYFRDSLNFLEEKYYNWIGKYVKKE